MADIFPGDGDVAAEQPPQSSTSYALKCYSCDEPFRGRVLVVGEGEYTDTIDYRPYTIIPCGHSVCGSCRETVLAHTHKCPHCYLVIQSCDAPNLGLCELAELSYIASHANDASTDGCGVYDVDAVETDDVKLGGADNMEPLTPCLPCVAHATTPASCFCTLCRSALCEPCATTEHSRDPHDALPLAAAVALLVPSLEDSTAQFEETAQRMQLHIASVNDAAVALTDSTRVAQAQLDELEASLSSSLRTHLQQLRSSITTVAATRQKQLDSQRDMLLITAAHCGAAAALCTHAKDSTDPVVVAAAAVAVKELSGLQTTEFVGPAGSPFLQLVRNAECLTGALKHVAVLQLADSEDAPELVTIAALQDKIVSTWPVSLRACALLLSRCVCLWRVCVLLRVNASCIGKTSTTRQWPKRCPPRKRRYAAHFWRSACARLCVCAMCNARLCTCVRVGCCGGPSACAAQRPGEWHVVSICGFRQRFGDDCVGLWLSLGPCPTGDRRQQRQQQPTRCRARSVYPPLVLWCRIAEIV